jgi:hypothetical protein
MKEYQNAQTKYKTDIKKKVKRQVQIVKPGRSLFDSLTLTVSIYALSLSYILDATTEEIDAVFKAGGGSGEVLKSAILTV